MQVQLTPKILDDMGWQVVPTDHVDREKFIRHEGPGTEAYMIRVPFESHHYVLVKRGFPDTNPNCGTLYRYQMEFQVPKTTGSIEGGLFTEMVTIPSSATQIASGISTINRLRKLYEALEGVGV